MKFATRMGCLGMAMALMLSLAAVRPARADDTTTGRVAVTYEVLVDWTYPPTGQEFHKGYLITYYYDDGNVTQVQDNGAQADIQSFQCDGWTANVGNPNIVSTTPW